MGGTSVPERSSLDRLKVLDSLPDLESQLQEAKSLCNHNSRAEMILRWLLAKLKASDDARIESACWEMLSSCLRIISTSRIASLLGSNGFIESLQSTCSGMDLPTRSMHAIAGSLNLLFELCDQDSGIAIKSLLSIDSSIAVEICGNWFRLVYETHQGTEGPTPTPAYSLLEPALKMWSIRKRSSSDDELFGATCSVSALLLLQQIRGQTRSDSRKRKRGSRDLFDARAAVHTLESMIAKHVILPARAVFFKDREGHSYKSPRRRSTETNLLEIKERLGPLKMAVLRQDNQKMAKAIPLLLDVALRSVAMPTPRHRLNERPWIENLLAALRSCLSTQDRTLRNQVLAEMLDAIHHEGQQLSVLTLSAAAKDEAFPSEDSREVDWDLIAKVARLDANVFCEKALMDILFNALTSYHATSGEGSVARPLAEDIAVPVIKAHAKSRTLNLFVDGWIEQLARPENYAVKSLWTDLAARFAGICEEAMTPEQIVTLFEKLAADVSSNSDPLKLSNEPQSSCQLFASFTVLNGLLAGIRNYATIAKLQDGLDALHRGLQLLARSKMSKNAAPLLYQLWTLSTHVFDLWFPTWAIKQSSREDVVENGLTDSLQATFKIALSQCIPKGDIKDGNRIVQAAQMFVATICTCFGRYSESEQCRTLCAEAVECLDQEQSDVLPVFLMFPSLLAHVDSRARKALISRLLGQTGPSPEEDQGPTALRIRALISTASTLPQQDVLDDIVEALLDGLQVDKPSQLTSRLELMVLSAFSAIDLASARQEQRVDMLDALLRLQPPPWTQLGSKQLQHRLALLVSLLQHPCRGARLLADAEGIWHIVKWFRDTRVGKKAASKPVYPLDSLNNLEMFDEVARLLVSSLVATRNQKSTKDVLANFIEETKKRVEQLRNGKDIGPATRTTSLVLFKNIFGAVGQGDSNALMIDHDSDATVLYLSALAAELKSFVSVSATDLTSIWTEGGKSGPLLWIFDALVAIPDGVRPSPPRMELADAVKSLAYCMLEWEHVGLPEKGFPELSRIKVASFQVACKYDPAAGQRLLPLAQKLLQRDLTAREHMFVLSTFEDMFKADDDEWTMALQQMMLDQPGQSPAALILEQKAIKTLSDEDLEGSNTGTGHLKGTQSFTAFQIFDHTLSQVSNNPTLQAKQIALQTLIIIFKEKSFMVNQYDIEQTIATLHNLLKTYKHASALYTDICSILSTLFIAHRSRLQGRFHLLTALFQALLTRIFTNTHVNAEVPVRHARLLARLLESFCNPQIRTRNSNNNKSNTKAPSSLIDETRKAQARAGQYAQYILHHYCSQLLTGSSPEGVREALRPGLWTVIEAIESYNPEGIKVLSAAMNASERAVLRGVYEDWRRFGKWEGL